MALKPLPKDNVKAALDAFMANPVGFATLTAVVIGGCSVYFSITGDVASFRKDFQNTVERAQSNNQRQDAEIVELRSRIGRSESAFEDLRKNIQDMRSDVREITTNMRWLTRERGQQPILPLPLDGK